MSNFKTLVVLSVLTIGLIVSRNIGLHKVFLNHCEPAAQTVAAIDETYGVLTGQVPLEKYLNIQKIMDSMVY